MNGLIDLESSKNERELTQKKKKKKNYPRRKKRMKKARKNERFLKK